MNRPLTMATRLVFKTGLTKSDPRTQPVTILGQVDNLRKVGFGDVGGKLGGRVGEEHYKTCLESLSPSPSDSVALYMNYATVVALPSKCSRHNTPSRAHSLAKILKNFVSHAEEEFVVLISPHCHLIPLVSAISRSFPLYSRKTKESEKTHTVFVEFITTDDVVTEDDVKLFTQVGDAVRNAAKLVDMPCNELSVGVFIGECESIVRELPGVSMDVVRGEELDKRGFGGIYNVGKVHTHPNRQPALVTLSYKTTTDSNPKTVCWVGKGIVFDTGGLSIKGRTAMCGMKHDMGGAAGVLYAFKLAVQIGCDYNLHAVLCLAENSISADAMRVDDVIKLYSGRTVEVNNTDAEGRLVLGDGVAYAKGDLKADVIVDVATLTGAQGIATGKYHSAIVSNCEDYESKFVKAGKSSGDLTFPLPFSPELHFAEFNSAIADMKNSVADRGNAQSSCAGLFIFNHIGFDWEGKWVHVDMASPVSDGDRGTGYGVLLLNYVFNRLGD